MNLIIYARGLKTNRTNTIAVILPTIWNPFFSELAYNIGEMLKKSRNENDSL